MSDMFEVKPTAIVSELLLTATTAISHHDPAVQDKSNRTVFNRQKQLWCPASPATAPSQEQVDLVCRAYPVPAEMQDILADCSFREYVATCLTRLFVRIYNRRNDGDGEGLFSGVKRYAMLEPRLRQAAVRSHTLRGWWNRVCNDMVVTIHEEDFDQELLPLLALPRGLQQMVLDTLVRDYRSVVAMAREWSQAAREDAERVELGWSAAAIVRQSGVEEIEVPAVSGNTLRHQVVRAPAWLHLCRHIGLDPAWPGQGPLPAGVEALFVNGGNIESGVKQSGSVFYQAQAARRAYPTLDLLGGVTDTFDLGESRLSVAGWLVCRENREVLGHAAVLPEASVSAFDMLDDRVETRQAHAGEGQMIRNFEVLCPGARVLCRLVLEEYTPSLTRGALAAALETFAGGLPVVGGQAARGYGWMQVVCLTALRADAEREAYEAYLRENAEALRAGLADGTLGTGSVVVT